MTETSEEENEDGFADDNAEEQKDIGDHIATIYTQIPQSVNAEMRDLATQMLKVEQKIVCQREPGSSSRLEFDEQIPFYDPLGNESTTQG